MADDAAKAETGREAGDDVGTALLRAADELRRRVGALTEPHGVTPQQYNVLQILRAEHPRPIPTLEIGSRLLDRTPGTSRLLERLAAKGLVRRERPAANRRIVNCTITAEGLRIVSLLEASVAGLNREVTRALGGEAGRLAVRLDQLAAHLAGTADQN